MKTNKFDAKALAEAAIFASIAFVLDFLQEKIWGMTPLFVNGGGIGIAMVPIVIIALRRGVFTGGICGLITGILQMLGGVTTFPSNIWWQVFIQILLDYTITYMMVGIVAGIFHHVIDKSKTKTFNLVIVGVATFAGGVAKFLCHFLSGCFFWPSDVYGAPWIYSMVYNGSYCLPCAIISIILIEILYEKAPRFYYADGLQGVH